MVRDGLTARGGRQWPWALVSDERTEGGCRGSMRDERHRQAAAAERRGRVAAMPASACRPVGSGQMESSVSSGSGLYRGVSPTGKAAAGSTTTPVRGAGSGCGPAGGRCCAQQRRATALRTLFAIGVGLVMHARGATGPAPPPHGCRPPHRGSRRGAGSAAARHRTRVPCCAARPSAAPASSRRRGHG